MRVWTYEEARDKVLLDTDLQEQESGTEFVTPNEVIGYFNEAIDEAEAEIHKLHEDYFVKRGAITLVNGTADYALPSDIYANKIRAVLYINGSEIYEIKRVTNDYKFLRAEISNINASGTEDYRYVIVNDDSTTGYRLRLFPTAYESGAYVKLWYLRNATRIPLIGEAKPTSGTYSLADVEAFNLDIPEFTNFLLQFVKCRILAKQGDPRVDREIAILQSHRKMMVDTLTQMVPDDHDEVPADYSHYQEHS